MRMLLCTAFVLLFQFTVRAQSKQFLVQEGTVDSVYSKSLKEYRKFYVQLPGDFNPKNNKKYPVAYILDGEVFLPAVSVFQQFYSGGFTPEMVLIGISNNKNRTLDLTPTKITSKYGMPFREKSGGAAKFYNFIADELIPYVAKKYPVTDYRTLIGHSYGGLFTIYTLLHHQQLFANYLAIDPSLDWDHQLMLKLARKILAANDYKGKALYLSLSGQLDMQNPGITIKNVMQDTSDYTLFPRSNIGFADIVKQNKQDNLTFKWQFFPNDIHGTVAIPSIRSGLMFLFNWFQMEKTYKFNTPDTPATELYKIIRHRENKLKSHFGYTVPPYPEGIFNMLGDMALNSGQLKKAKTFFELAIKYYPNSPNVYGSMADYYMATKDYTEALKNVTKAWQLSGSDIYKQRIENVKKKMDSK